MDRETMKTILADEMIEVLKDGQACKHKGCLHHIMHPCEGCGRIAGKGVISLPKSLLDGWEEQRKADET